MTVGLLYCLIVLLYVCLVAALCDIFHTPMARCSLIVLKVSLNTNQPYRLLANPLEHSFYKLSKIFYMFLSCDRSPIMSWMPSVADYSMKWLTDIVDVCRSLAPAWVRKSPYETSRWICMKVR